MKLMNLKLAGSDDFFTQEAYKTLRTNLQFCGQDIKVIAVTSCYENEGKTTVSLNLARSLTELGKKVLYLDADMRKSVMAARHTDVKNPAGLSELLTGMVKLSDCIYMTQEEQLHVIFSSKYPPNPVELLDGKYFASLIAETRKVFDYVIIDTPPLGRVIDAAVIAPNCDGVIMVMADNSVRSKHAREVVEQLRKADARILGVVRNSVRNKRQGYYNNQGSKYYSAYGKK